MLAIIRCDFENPEVAGKHYNAAEAVIWEEHKRYYGTPAGSGSRRRAVGVECGGHYGGRQLADHLFVALAMDDETGEESSFAYNLASMSYNGQIHPECGYASQATGWQTSGGNVTAIRHKEDTAHVDVVLAGVRHGIRWWPLASVIEDDDLSILEVCQGLVKVPRDNAKEGAAMDLLRQSFNTTNLACYFGVRHHLFHGLGVGLVWSREPWPPTETKDDQPLEALEAEMKAEAAKWGEAADKLANQYDI